MKELRWERCRDNRYAGYDGNDFVALLKHYRFEDAWKWHLLDEHGEPVEFGDEPTLKLAKQEAGAAYRAAEELLK